MDVDELDYLEKHALSPVRRRSSSSYANSPARPRQKIAYHSRITGEGYFGLSAYGLIVLAFFIFTALFFYGIAYGFLHICSHYVAAHIAAHSSQLLR